MQMGYKLWTGRTVCKKVQKSSNESNSSQAYFMRYEEGMTIPESTLSQMRIGLKMQSQAYMFINRIGSYHANLSLDTFFKVKLVRMSQPCWSEGAI